MQPKLSLLTEDLIQRILDEAFQLMLKPGIKVQNEEARELLKLRARQVDEETFVAQIPEQLVHRGIGNSPAPIPSLRLRGQSQSPVRRRCSPLRPGLLRHRRARPGHAGASRTRKRPI